MTLSQQVEELEKVCQSLQIIAGELIATCLCNLERGTLKGSTLVATKDFERFVKSREGHFKSLLHRIKQLEDKTK